MAYNTGNPVEPNGSTDPRDLRDNAQILDKLVNSSDLTWLGRLGKALKTWAGMEKDFSDLLLRSGFESIYIPYAAGAVVDRATQLVQRDGDLYRVTNQADLPLTLSGTWAADAPKLTAVADQGLRSALAGPAGTTMVGRPSGTLEDSLLQFDKTLLPGFLKQQGSVLRTLSGSTLGDVSQFSRALAAGLVKIVIAGDSIAEGKSQVNPDDSWVMVFVRALRAAYPGVTFVVANMSLAGRGTGNLASDGYVGIAGPDNPEVGFYQAPGSQSTGHWPAGSTIGKTWKEHIRDQAPDLIIQPLGMNDLTGTSNDNAAVTKLCLDYYRTFPKVPSVALMTPMQPSNLIPPFDGFQERIRANAEIYRGICAQFNLTLLDANRLCFLYRDAVDIVNTKGHRRLIDGFPTGWTKLSGSGYSISGGVLTGSGITRRDEACRDVYIDVAFTLSNYTTMVPGVEYRMDLATPANAYTVQIQSGTTVILYWQSTVLSSDLIAPLVNGAPVRIEVKCRGAQHRIYVNRALVLTWYDYNKLSEGATAVSIDGGSGAISNYTMVKFEPLAVGRQMFSQGDLLGYVNDFDTNPDSLGGSAGNHPSALGHSVMYADACLPMFRIPRASGSSVAFAKATGTENFYGSSAGPSARTQVDGINGPLLLVSGVTGGEICSLQQVELVAGGRSININVQSTTSAGTAAILSTNLVLGSGSWVVTVRATLSRNASGVLNALDAVAIKAA
jgi:lysophospholipase L1-like esterase